MYNLEWRSILLWNNTICTLNRSSFFSWSYRLRVLAGQSLWEKHILATFSSSKEVSLPNYILRLWITRSYTLKFSHNSSVHICRHCEKKQFQKLTQIPPKHNLKYTGCNLWNAKLLCFPFVQTTICDSTTRIF